MTEVKNLLILLGFVLSFKDSLQQTYNTSTLKFVHVIFRHGDRTADSYCPLYNPAVKETFYPDGFGALTLRGKTREYEIGTYLRRKYNDWLGSIYYPDVISVRSTDYPRTKMSAQLVTAGLFPPAPSQTWNWNINWQPIPYNYVSGKDSLMGFPILCTNFLNEFNKMYNTTQVQNQSKSRQFLFDYIAKYSRPLASNPVLNAYTLYNCLYVWDDFKIPLPNWAKLIYPNGIKSAALWLYTLLTNNPLLTKMGAGQLLAKIISDSDSIAAGTFTPATQKISLFSGHEYNIALTLRALKAFDPPQWPSFGSYIIFELHQINNEYGYKIFFQNYKEFEPIPVIIPGCSEFCPLSKVKTLLVDSIPNSTIAAMC